MNELMNFKLLGRMAIKEKNRLYEIENILHRTEKREDTFRKIEILENEKKEKMLFLNGFMEAYYAKEKVDLKDYTQYEEKDMKYILTNGKRIFLLNLQNVNLNTRLSEMFPRWNEFMKAEKMTLGEYLDDVEAGVVFPTIQSIMNGSIMFVPERVGIPSKINLAAYGIITRLIPKDIFVHRDGNLPIVFKLNDNIFLVVEPEIKTKVKE